MAGKGAGIYVRCTPEQAERARAKAADADMSVSELVRTLLDDANRICGTCDGSGTYVVQCKRCSGSGLVEPK